MHVSIETTKIQTIDCKSTRICEAVPHLSANPQEKEVGPYEGREHLDLWTDVAHTRDGGDARRVAATAAECLTLARESSSGRTGRTGRTCVFLQGVLDAAAGHRRWYCTRRLRYVGTHALFAPRT